MVPKITSFTTLYHVLHFLWIDQQWIFQMSNCIFYFSARMNSPFFFANYDLARQGNCMKRCRYCNDILQCYCALCTRVTQCDSVRLTCDVWCGDWWREGEGEILPAGLSLTDWGRSWQDPSTPVCLTALSCLLSCSALTSHLPPPPPPPPTLAGHCSVLSMAFAFCCLVQLD